LPYLAKVLSAPVLDADVALWAARAAEGFAYAPLDVHFLSLSTGVASSLAEFATQSERPNVRHAVVAVDFRLVCALNFLTFSVELPCRVCPIPAKIGRRLPRGVVFL
jgi:hypothetical protein